MNASSLRLLGSVSVLVLVAVACKKEEPPPPLPAAAPVVTAPAPLQLKVEDAGVPPAPSAEPKKGGGGGGGGLGPCCAALAQNATMAPEPTKTYMVQAAALCQSMAAMGKDKAAVGGMLLGALRGAGMPTACK